MKIELSKPLHYKDTELSELDIDLDSLTGRDLIDIEDALQAKGKRINAWEMSRSFLIAVAAKGAHLPAEVLEATTISDFTKITGEVISFLAGLASGDSMPDN